MCHEGQGGKDMKICYAALVLALFWTSGAYADRYVVSQQDRQFSVPYIAINPGDTVDFVNQDNVTHNVFSNTEGAEFNLGKFAPSSKETVTFNDKTPVVDVQCSIHPNMKMTIFVNVDWRRTLNEAMLSGTKKK